MAAPSPNKTVLISGAGVAGLALAWWLQRFGFTPTLIEHSPSLRGGGQAVDVRGIALDVLKAMGMLEDAQAQRTHFGGMTVFNAAGEQIAETHERTYSGGRFDSGDMEVFRDALCDVIHAHSPDIETLFGDTITGIAQNGSVAVTFQHNAPRKFDYVVGADGIFSNVRKLVFAEGHECVQSLGAVLALYTAPNTEKLDNWEWAYREEAIGLVAYPTLDNRELRVGVGFAAETTPELRADPEAQKALILANAGNLGGRLHDLVEAVRTTPQIYLGDIAQVHLAQWWNDRVVLAGDAAHCASPFSGQGTSLALVGAFVLARELANAPDAPATAFASYQKRMQPYVELNQGLVDMERTGPVPDDQLTRAKFGIELPDLANA